MIPSNDYTNLLPYDQCAYEALLKERQKELLQFREAINQELMALELELQVLEWRQHSNKLVTKKITLYEDFFKNTRKAPRQEKKSKPLDHELLQEAKEALEEIK